METRRKGPHSRGSSYERGRAAAAAGQVQRGGDGAGPRTPSPRSAHPPGRRRSHEALIRTLLVGMLILVCAGVAQAADQREVQDVLEKYRSLRPQAHDLTIYQLDW